MIYKCTICGNVHDEEETSIPLQALKYCPICKQPITKFIELKDLGDKQYPVINGKKEDLAYSKQFARTDSKERYMDTIHEIAISGETIISPMSTRIPMPNWDDILIMACQLNPMPLERDIEVSTKTVIGKNAKKPMVLESPVYISHMSFGAISKEAKIALAKGSAIAKTATSSGEGGVLKEEIDNAYKYIFEYIPNEYSFTPENLKKSSAIEIKIGQSTKPGIGGHLPGDKVTSTIAKLRGKPIGEDIHSPVNFPNVKSPDDLKDLVSKLRKDSNGKPIGIKIAAEKIEKDLEVVTYSKADFVTIDGRGGATGASPLLVRNSTSVPTVYALDRARKFLDENKYNIDLVITGGLRVSSDFAKALALGANGIAIGSAAIIAAACQQYRICGTGECPVGVATQRKDLRERFKVETSAKRVANFLTQSNEELKTFARITGYKDVHNMNVNDLATFNSEISNYTRIKHV